MKLLRRVILIGVCWSVSFALFANPENLIVQVQKGEGVMTLLKKYNLYDSPLKMKKL